MERVVGKRVVESTKAPSDDDTSAEMSKVIMERNTITKDSEVEYLVKWYGLGDAHATWEPATVSSCSNICDLQTFSVLIKC